MRKYTFLVIHCTATPEGREVSKQDIIRWHTAPPPRGNGWSRAGYNDLILLDGTIQNLVPFNQDEYVHPDEISNGAYGYNGIAKHLFYVGGTHATDISIPLDTRTSKQLGTMEAYLHTEVARFPNLMIVGHDQLDTRKDCPSFNVPEYLTDIGIPDKNIVQMKKMSNDLNRFDMSTHFLTDLIQREWK